MTKITIVIPCYNEANSLPVLIDQMKSVKLSCKFVLVDNGSNDSTESLLGSMSLPKNIRFVRKPINTGYGAGIKYGLKNIDTELVGWMHADLQQNLNILSKLDKKLSFLSNSDPEKLFALKGLRTGRSTLEIFFSAGVSVLTSAIFFKRCWDIAGQPNIFRFKDLWFLESSPDDHKFEFYVYIKFKFLGGSYMRFDAPFLNRRFGKSSWDKGIWSKVNHARKIFLHILLLRLTLR